MDFWKGMVSTIWLNVKMIIPKQFCRCQLKPSSLQHTCSMGHSSTFVIYSAVKPKITDIFLPGVSRTIYTTSCLPGCQQIFVANRWYEPHHRTFLQLADFRVQATCYPSLPELLLRDCMAISESVASSLYRTASLANMEPAIQRWYTLTLSRIGSTVLH